MFLVIAVKILFKNVTKYSKEIYDEFLAFHQSKYNLQYFLYTLFVFLCFLFCIVLQVIYRNFTLVILFFVFLICFMLYRYFNPQKKISKEYESEKIKEEKMHTFIFYEKFFTISDGNSSSKVKYYKLYRVFETKKFFYLYLNKSNAFLIDKSKFIRNKEEQFSNFISKKCWWIYRKVE